jgi:hypothetical protein
VIPVDWHGGTPPGLGGGLLTFWGRFRRNFGFADLVWELGGRPGALAPDWCLGCKGLRAVGVGAFSVVSGISGGAEAVCREVRSPGDAGERGPALAQWPVKVGVRLAMKASTASRWSAVAPRADWAASSSASACSRSALAAVSRACLILA